MNPLHGQNELHQVETLSMLSMLQVILYVKTRQLYIRGADIMLLKAEALAHQGDLNGAATLVNDIRKRAKLKDLTINETGSQDAMLDAILNERRLELALEGQRLFDLIRFGKLLEVMNGINSRDEGRLPQARPFVEEHKLMPIPQTALDKNPNLIQNMGY